MASIPPITQTLLDQARFSPGGWVYVVDPEFDPDGQVPPYGIVGGRRGDDSGELTSEFQENPNYRPSATALEWRQPITPLEHMLQLVATGRQPDAALIKLFVTESVWIFSRAEGGIYMATRESGERVVGAFTDRGLVTGGDGLDSIEIIGGRLAEALPDDVSIVINPGHIPFARIGPPQVRAALAAMS